MAQLFEEKLLDPNWNFHRNTPPCCETNCSSWIQSLGPIESFFRLRVSDYKRRIQSPLDRLPSTFSFGGDTTFIHIRTGGGGELYFFNQPPGGCLEILLFQVASNDQPSQYSLLGSGEPDTCYFCPLQPHAYHHGCCELFSY